jgi:hypothetical protein
MFETRKAAGFAVTSAAFMLCAMIASSPARATNEIVMVDIDGAMSTPDAKEKLDGTVKFYFGSAPHAAVLHKYGQFVSNKKANGFLRDDALGCGRAFLSALISFQAKAHKVGGDAVINIHSYYQKQEENIGKEVPCHSGGLMDGVALRGDIVKLAN